MKHIVLNIKGKVNKIAIKLLTIFEVGRSIGK